MTRMIHKIVQIPVIFHEDDEVCPLSRGEPCVHVSEDGHPFFQDPADLERLNDIPNLKKLSGLNGLRPPPGYSWNDLTPGALGYRHPYEGGSVASAATTGHADSGLGESLEGTNRHGFQNDQGDGFHLPSDFFGESRMDLDDEMDEMEDVDEDANDTVKPLPKRSEYKRYAKKQRIALQVLNNVTPQQIANLSPSLKSSMDQFISQLELHAGVRSKQENQLKVRNFLPPQSQDPEIYLVEKFGSARSNNEATDYPYGGEFSDAEGDGTFSYYPPSTVPPRSINYHQLPEKLRVQEDLFRTKAFRKEAEMRREHLLNRAKMLQARANKHKAKLSQMWEDKFKDEFAKTGPLEVVCNALREELDAAHKERIQAFEIKMQPIIIRDGPSKKANYKIQAARLHYDIYALTQRLRHTTMRAEHEEQRRERKERMVRKLREEISEKKTAITTVTKGIPFNKIEVRPEDQIPQPSFHPLPSNNKPSTKIGPRKPVYHPATPSVAAGTLSAAQRQFSGAGLRQGLLPALPNGGFRGANTSKKEGGPGSPTKTLNRTQTIPTK